MLSGQESGRLNFIYFPLFICFLNHCSECIIRWWNWIRKRKEADDANASRSSTSLKDMEDQTGASRCMRFLFSHSIVICEGE